MNAPRHEIGSDVADAMDRMIDLQLERHAWLSDAAAKVRRWREEDAANGSPWEIDFKQGENA